MGWADQRERLLRGEPEPDAPRRPLTVSELIEIEARTPQTAAWRAHIGVRGAGEGWLEITDPITGEKHEIHAHEALYVWWREIHG